MQTSSTQHRFEPPSAVPVLPRAPFTARALDSWPRRPPADPARSAPAAAAGTCRAAGLQPASGLHRLAPRPSAAPAAGDSCAAPPPARPRSFLEVGFATASRTGRELHCNTTGADHCLPSSQRSSGYSCAGFKSPLTPSFPLLGDCLLELTTQTPLVVVFSIITTMVSTCFLPSAQLSISKAFASAKLGEVRTALDSFFSFVCYTYI